MNTAAVMPTKATTHAPTVKMTNGRRLSALLAATALATGLAVSVSAASSSAAVATPTFVQQVSTQLASVTTVTLTPTAALGTGDRLVVLTGTWSGAHATIASVTDSAGDAFSPIIQKKASDFTEQTIWTAPVTSGAGTKPTITVTPTAMADVGVVVLEYSGILPDGGLVSVDQTAYATGTTGAAATVSSGSTPAITASNELALGFYVDSGFGATIAPGSGYAQRANVSPNGSMQLLVEDMPVVAGTTANASAGAGANTPWQMATVVFKPGSTGPATAPGAPGPVVATAGNAAASVAWSAGTTGGSAITSYTVTPYQGTTALSPVPVSGSPVPTSTTITGLTNGTSYTFKVTATNVVGTGPATTSNAVIPTTSPQGSWAPLQTWPIMPLATHLLPNGEIVAWDGWQQPQPSVVWNPANPGTFTTINAPDSIFCDGAAQLPDGRLLVIGGYGGLSTGQIGIVDTNIFDPTTHAWSRVADMNYPRWYPTVTELADGRYLAISGNTVDGMTWADTPEVYDPATNHWTVLPNVSTASVHEVEYPFTYLTPSGEVFVMGPEEDNSHLLNVDNQTWTSTGSAGQTNGSSVMYRPGKVMYSGGAALINTATPATNLTSVIDLTASNPAWRSTAPMNNARIYHTLTMLADGTVLSVGGANTSDQQVITTGVMPTEIWNPTTETWSPAAPIAASRNYHSTAVLLPDATVLVAGGGHSEGLQNAGQYSSQIFSPAYLSAGPRPTISSAPAAATYGTSMSVSTPDAASITGVNLVSLGADTHQIDMSQHFVPLSYTAGSGSLSVQAPADPALAPPGYYMLFILKNGVPSVAKMVHLGAAQTQTVPGQVTGVTATSGNGLANVGWNTPASGGSPITSYTVTPYQGTTALTPMTITGNPPATNTTVTGLINGATYTFKVAATNAVGTGAQSAASAAVTPSASQPVAFVQQANNISPSASALSVTPTGNLSVGNRAVVQVGVWSGAHATTTAVTDTAGNTYTKLGAYTASDGTQMTVWSAPITAGGKPVITATLTGAADVSIVATEYSGLSTAAGTGAVDVMANATGTTSGSAVVSSGATAATTTSSELALGFYTDSGFNSTLVAGSGWTQRTNVSPNSKMQMLLQDKAIPAGTAVSSTTTAGANTVWLAATIVFKPAAATPPTAPAAPTNVLASPGNTQASVSWTPGSNGGSAITGFTITPYLNSVAQAPISVAANVTATTITGLTNGQSYNFSVKATNSVGTSVASSLSNTIVPNATVNPKFVQGASAHALSVTSLGATLNTNVTSGNRIVVQASTWGRNNAVISGVADSAGNTYTKVLSTTASDSTQMTVWTAVVANGAGTKPTVTATTSGSADIGVGVMEYSGLAAANPVDVTAAATGKTTTAQPVSSGSTAPTTAPVGLSIGFYADSGFGGTLSADAGYAQRVNLSGMSDMDILVEDAVVTAGAAPAPSIGTSANTVWLAGTVVFKGA